MAREGGGEKDGERRGRGGGEEKDGKECGSGCEEDTHTLEDTKYIQLINIHC